MAKTADPDTHLLMWLLNAAAEIRGLLPVLKYMLAEPDSNGPDTGTTHRTPDGSEPWNSAVGAVYTDIWYGLGTMVNELRISAGMRSHFRKPAGYVALDEILNIAPVASAEALKQAGHRLAGWVNRAKQLPAIDEAEPWVPVPGTPACPYCHTRGLRMRKRAGDVSCFYPDCKDADGRPTRARMEPGRMTGESRLIFGDGTMMHWAGDGE